MPLRVDQPRGPGAQVPALDGVYARKQLRSRARLVAWSHGHRFRVALELAGNIRPARLLDYGCGDGSFLALLAHRGIAPAQAVGTDIASDLIVDCRRRFGPDGPRFVHPSELGDESPFDAVFCMEVLEHVVNRGHVLDDLARLLAPTGRLVISVPVETGLPLIAKQMVRTVAGWRRIGDYPGTSPYKWNEWLPSLFAGSRQHITRPILREGAGPPFHDHKGFNWMTLRRELGERFAIQHVFSSPFTTLPPHLGTQAWFVLQKRS